MERMIFEFFCAVIIVIDAILLPYQFAFEELPNQMELTIIGTAVFLVDILVRAVLFAVLIHFELARLAAGTTVDILHAPLDYFRRF